MSINYAWCQIIIYKISVKEAAPIIGGAYRSAPQVQSALRRKILQCKDFT